MKEMSWSLAGSMAVWCILFLIAYGLLIELIGWLAETLGNRYPKLFTDEAIKRDADAEELLEDMESSSDPEFGSIDYDKLMGAVGRELDRRPRLVEDYQDRAFANDVENLQPEKPQFPTTPPRLAS